MGVGEEVYVGGGGYNHPEVDGVYREYMWVLSKIIFNRFQDGCTLVRTR